MLYVHLLAVSRIQGLSYQHRLLTPPPLLCHVDESPSNPFTAFPGLSTPARRLATWCFSPHRSPAPSPLVFQYHRCRPSFLSRLLCRGLWFSNTIPPPPACSFLPPAPSWFLKTIPDVLARGFAIPEHGWFFKTIHRALAHGFLTQRPHGSLEPFPHHHLRFSYTGTPYCSSKPFLAPMHTVFLHQHPIVL